MTEPDWLREPVHCLGVYESVQLTGPAGDTEQLVTEQSLLLLLNAGDQAVIFRVPPPAREDVWKLELDTSWPDQVEVHRRYRGGRRYALRPRSMAVLSHQRAVSSSHQA